MKDRELIVTHLEGGMAVAGRCSRSLLAFREDKSAESPAISNRKLVKAFASHTCDEGLNKAPQSYSRRQCSTNVFLGPLPTIERESIPAPGKLLLA